MGTTRPKIVCLCGSTRFYQEYQQGNFNETLKGAIVLSVGAYPQAPVDGHGQNIGITPEQKRALDELHLRKIDLADEILIISVNGYIGESTRREIAYAQAQGKPVRWMEQEGQSDGILPKM